MFILNLLLLLVSRFWELGGGGPDGSGGAGAGGDAGAAGDKSKDKSGAGAGDAGGASGAPEAGKTFTQAELDKVVNERLRRERAQFSDYDDIKAKAEKFDAAEEAKKTDAQKEADARAARERTDNEKSAAADRRLITAEIKAQAAGRVHNLDHVVALLMGSPGIKVKGDTVEGAKEALEALLTEHPYLEQKAGAGPGTSGGDFSGRDQKTLDEQIAAAEAAGNWRESTRLKLAKARSQQG